LRSGTAQSCGCKPRVITGRRKYTPRGIYDIDAAWFDAIDSEPKAYFLGLLYADGTTDGKHSARLALHHKDEDILKEFNRHLGHTKPLRRQKAGPMVELEIANKPMVASLVRHGLIPNKTFTLTYPEWMPAELRRHFLRGYSDGDGCWTTSRQKPTRSLTYHWSVVSTESFCRSVANLIKTDLGINSSLGCRFPERNNTTRTLQVGGNRQLAKLANYLYRDATVFLHRKRDVAGGLLCR
jgi:hypothetical protein